MSERFCNKTENSPRPWLCMARQRDGLLREELGVQRVVAVVDQLRDQVAGRPGHLFSFSSAPGANAHVADAQLPAYCRIAGRNDTRSGRMLPSTGKKHSPAKDGDGQPRRDMS